MVLRLIVVAKDCLHLVCVNLQVCPQLVLSLLAHHLHLLDLLHEEKLLTLDLPLQLFNFLLPLTAHLAKLDFKLPHHLIDTAHLLVQGKVGCLRLAAIHLRLLQSLLKLPVLASHHLELRTQVV